MRALAVTTLVVIAASLPLRAAAPADQRFEYSEPHMGTIVRLVLYAADAAGARSAAARAFARVRALDDALSDYRDTSELNDVSRRAGGAPVAVSDDLFRVLTESQRFARASGGAFDVTVGPLSLLWREARRRQSLPDASRLAAARALVGSGKLRLDNARRTVELRVPGMQLDAGGIAKGFAADEAAAVLRDCGIRSALVAAGGDIVVTAAPPGAEGWRVAVASIAGPQHPPASYLSLHDAAVSTSGDAEQFMVVNGIRYSHIFDPRTGRALRGRTSVTIVAPNGTTSDALATAVSVLGGEKGVRLADRTPGVAALIVDGRNAEVRTYESRRWREIRPR